MAKRSRHFAAAARDQLRDWIEGGPLESLALKVQDMLSAPGPGVLAERRDIALMREICRRVLRESSNAIDVGANIGRVSRMFTRCAPRGTHHAFEPIPRLARRLRRRFPGMNVHQSAVGDENGEVTFYQQIANHPQSSLHAPEGRDDDVETITVPMVRLDDIIDAELSVDLIKIDVEGAEMQVLQGGAATIERCKPHIIFEYSASNNDPAIHDLLTSRFGLEVRTLEGMLANDPALDLAQFQAVCAAGEVWNYIASPPSSL